jgi:hypothetical protein
MGGTESAAADNKAALGRRSGHLKEALIEAIGRNMGRRRFVIDEGTFRRPGSSGRVVPIF